MFELIFIYCLLTLVLLGLSHLWLYFISTEKRNLTWTFTYRFDVLYSTFQLQMQEIDRFVNYKVEVKFLHKKISCPHNILSLKAHTLSNVHYLLPTLGYGNIEHDKQYYANQPIITVTLNRASTSEFHNHDMWKSLKSNGNPLSPTCVNVFAPTGTNITHQTIELERCSNRLKMQKVFQFQFAKMAGFAFELFVGDITVGTDLGFLDGIIRPWAPTARGNFLFLSFKKIR